MKLQQAIKDKFSFRLSLAIIFLSLSIVGAAQDAEGLGFSVQGKGFTRTISPSYAIALETAQRDIGKELRKDTVNFRQDTKEDLQK